MMKAGRILVMRHAEKTKDPNDPDLSRAGHARAKELARYMPKKFGKPDFLFASAFSKHSHRPYETLKPLSKKVGVPIDTTFADQDYSALANEITTDKQFDGKLIIVCWHHGNIPSLAHALQAKDGSYPDPWDPSVFNLILQFDYSAGVPCVREIKEKF
jgi:broad specificity phosphatase PhoE